MKAVSDYNDVNELRRLMDNARDMGRQDVVDQAFKRICELEGRDYDDALEREFYATLAAYEELLYEKHGRRQKAARTRQKLEKKTFMECLADWANSKIPSEGFKNLIDRDMPQFTAEYLVCKYADRFLPDTVQRARDRLVAEGVSPP